MLSRTNLKTSNTNYLRRSPANGLVTIPSIHPSTVSVWLWSLVTLRGCEDEPIHCIHRLLNSISHMDTERLQWIGRGWLVGWCRQVALNTGSPRPEPVVVFDVVGSVFFFFFHYCCLSVSLHGRSPTIL